MILEIKKKDIDPAQEYSLFSVLKDKGLGFKNLRDSIDVVCSGNQLYNVGFLVGKHMFDKSENEKSFLLPNNWVERLMQAIEMWEQENETTCNAFTFREPEEKSKKDRMKLVSVSDVSIDVLFDIFTLYGKLTKEPAYPASLMLKELGKIEAEWDVVRDAKKEFKGTVFDFIASKISKELADLNFSLQIKELEVKWNKGQDENLYDDITVFDFIKDNLQ